MNRDECPTCPHQTFVHGLSGGCSARGCDCTRDNTGRERSAVKLAAASVELSTKADE